MRKTKIKDILSYEFFSNLDISNDKSKLAYTRVKGNFEKNKYDSNIWIYLTKTGETYPITDDGNSSIYTFDKDSNLIYKAKSNDEKDSFKKVTDHGIGREIFSIKKDLASIKWLKDDLFLVKASDKKSKKEKAKDEKNKYFKKLDTLPFYANGEGYLDYRPSAYYFYDSKKDQLSKIIDSSFDKEINLFSLNDDFTKAIFCKTDYDDNKVMGLKEDLILLDIDSKEEKALIKEEFSYYRAEFLDDKIIFVATNMEKGGVNEDAFIYSCDFEGNYKKISDDDFDMDFGNSLGTDARYGDGKTFVKANDKLYFITTEKESTKLYSIDIKGDLFLEVDDEVEDFTIKDEDIYYFSMGKNTLAELKKNKEEKILIANKVQSNVSSIKTFEFESNGDMLKGFVLLPTNFDENIKYPTILSIHGGPKTEFSDIFHHEHQVFANDGYIIIYTNPHGSSGNGVKFSDIRGKYGDIDYDDLMRFTDLAIEKFPQIDANKMGVYGGSYGGFMTNWIIGHTNRFKAACSQRSISNWTSFYGVSDIGYYFASDQTNGDIWNSFDNIWNQSPIKYADKVKTPTLFIHSDCDYRCSLEQGLQMYSKIKLNGVESKMFVFHGENHELSRSGKPHARLKRLKEIKKWFDGHLK